MKKVSSWLMLASLWLCAAVTHAGTVTYVYTDPQGTPLAEADASGNITARFEYTPYGVSVSSMGAAPNGVGYTGHVNDPETGLVYMQARYYDAEVGRFLSVDPVGPSAGSPFSFNRFSYVNNNPIVNIDPDGTTCTRSGSSESYECHVDSNDGKFTDRQIKDTNKAYTDTVNTLNSHPNATVAVTVQGVSFKAKAGDVARGLISAKVVTALASSTARAQTAGGGLFATSNYFLNYTPEITIFKNAVTSDRRNGTAHIEADLRRTFAHEGIHTVARESALFNVYKANEDHWGTLHLKEYNRAGDKLLDGDR
jgi:RHS repeat-associated protein